MAKNPFDMYTTTQKKATIKALNNAEIEYRELTMEEDDAFQQSVVKGIGDDGKPDLDMKKYLELKYHKVAAGLINPKMTVGDLKKLSKKADDAINEILVLITGNDKIDAEGN